MLQLIPLGKYFTICMAEVTWRSQGIPSETSDLYINVYYQAGTITLSVPFVYTQRMKLNSDAVLSRT